MFRNIHCWLPGYFLDRAKKILRPLFLKRPIHIFLSICDHFEPTAENVNREKALQRVKIWVERYPEIAKKYRDSTGCLPKYTFFYPIEEYRHEELELLAKMCQEGYGEVEIHLHHDNDTAGNLRNTLLNYKNLLSSKYNLLSKDKNTDEICYGFIHGNWALDNSRLDGRFCGINNEINILQETGCYADFTLPSAPDETQTQKVNSIYYAIGDQMKPKSHNWGVDVKSADREKGLLIVQGVLMLDWKRRKWGIFPGIENSHLHYDTPLTPQRIRLWIKAGIHIVGRANWIFVKVHTHGCVEKNIKNLLNVDLDFLFSYLNENYNDRKSFFLHFVSAREAYNIIKTLETEDIIDDSNIDKYRNYRLHFNGNYS